MKRVLIILLCLTQIVVAPLGVFAAAENGGSGSDSESWGENVPAPIGIAGIKAAFLLRGWTFSERLFTNAVGKGEDLYFGKTIHTVFRKRAPRHIVDAIKYSPSFMEAAADAIENAGNGVYKGFYTNIVVDGDNDAHYSLHGMSGGVEIFAAHIATNIYKLWVTVKDRYDFDGGDVSDGDDNNTYDEFVRNGIKFSHKLQESGELKNFDVTIGFSIVTDELLSEKYYSL